MNFNHNLVRDLAKKYHTPLYIFSEKIIRDQCRKLKASISYPNIKIRYACKALTLGAILKIIKSEGIDIDASSINEVNRALLAGFSADQIVYTGESSSKLVYQQLVDQKVEINCTSLDQLELLGVISPGYKCCIRFNPGEGHGESNKTNTGGPASKHGIYYDQIEQVKKIIKKYSLRLNGVHSHIGSGTDLSHWLRIKDLTFQIARQFQDLEFINLGGGLPVVYNPQKDQPMPLNQWGEALSQSFLEFSTEYGKNIQLQIEPGRYLVAESGILVAEIQAIKKTPDYNFVIVNTGLNHNIRPAMYGSYHPIEFISSKNKELKGMAEYVIAGYLCESGDVFTVSNGGILAPRQFPLLELGDLMIMGNIGAYSHSMKSEYNSMNLPASILIESNNQTKLIERRGTLQDIIAREITTH